MNRRLTPDVQEKIEVYLRNAQSTARVWAFAVARDGTDGAMASCAAGSTYAGGRSCYPVLGTKEDLVKKDRWPDAAARPIASCSMSAGRSRATSRSSRNKPTI